ncbi:NAD-binding protein [Mesobacillus jeotgali]|uniref:NAD-binding protein n=1 Tax=Mesobacillus jeotgali TaxID=129985 RepID=UPI000C81A5E6|nr:NAD-binding protein [Mesobacillus jeotgali]
MKYHILAAIIFTLFGSIGIFYQWFNDPGYVLVLIAVSWVTTFFYVHFRLKKYIVPGFLILFTLASGIYGFCQHSHDLYKHSFLNSVYSTIRLFFLDVDSVFNDAANKYTEIPLPIELARWTAAFSTITTIGLFLLKYFGLSLKGELYSIFGGHIIVVGYNEKSSILIKNLRAAKQRVSVVADNFSDEDKKELFKLGVPIYIDESKDMADLLIKSGVKKAKHVILFHEDDFINLENYISIQNEVNPASQLQVSLHLEHPKSLQVYERMLKEEKDKIKSYSFSTYQLIAEKMLMENPLFLGYENQLRKPDGEPLHLLFIGFGKRNQRIAFQALNLCHFMTKNKIKFTIFDREIEKVKKEWGFLAKNADELADIKFEGIDLVNHDITKELAKIDAPITHVFLSLHDDFLDIIEGLELIEPLPDVPVFIKMKDNHKVSNWLDINEKEYKVVKRYASQEEVLNIDYVLNKTLIDQAKKAHDNYQKQRVKQNIEPDKNWDQLSSFKQESNRYQMLHNDTKLMLLGLKKSPKDETVHSCKPLSLEKFEKHIEPYKEALAEIEHKRWNAFHFLRGWNTASQDTQLSKVELENLKLHKSLVPWEELSEPTKDYDRDTIKYLLLYYKSQSDLVTEDGK